MEEGFSVKKNEQKIFEQKKAKIRKKIEEIYQQRERYLLWILFIGVVLFKGYYFFKTLDQAVWWDEGDYLAVGKELFQGGARPEWWSHFTVIRPLLMPVTWGFLFFLHSPEWLVKMITLLIPSILSVFLLYKIGKDMYNSQVGFIAAIMLAVQWVHNFYTQRLLTDIPAMFLGLLAVYFFWSKYIKEKEAKGLYLAVIFGVLAFTARFPLALVLITIFLFLLLTKQKEFFKDKVVGKSMLWGAAVLSPYIIYFIVTKFQLFNFYFGDEAVSMKTPISSAFNTIMPIIPQLLESIWFWGFILGILTLYKLVIGLDVVLKQKTKKLNADLFIVLFTSIHLLFYVVILRAANDRWLLMLLPPLFLLSARGITSISDFVKEKSKLLALGIIVVFLIMGASQQIEHTNTLTLSKINSYQEEKLAGLWLKENTPEDAAVIVASIVQNQYYSERQSYDFYSKVTPHSDCYDIYGKLIETDECFAKTEESFRKKIKDIDADYMIIHVFEPVFTPPWIYSYPDRHPGEVELVKYYNQGNNLVLAIYKFNKDSAVFS